MLSSLICIILDTTMVTFNTMTYASGYSFGHIPCDVKNTQYSHYCYFSCCSCWLWFPICFKLFGSMALNFEMVKVLKILRVISSVITFRSDNSILSNSSLLAILSSDAHVSDTGLRMSLLFGKLKVRRAL